jgi:dipeptidyl aminopeptidase/acylaminoacyl peptidase
MIRWLAAARPRQRARLKYLLAIMMLMGVASASEADTGCAASLIADTARATPARLPTAQDLVQLRDIGEGDSAAYRDPSPLAISPDQSSVAFVVHRADPVANRYCVGLFVLRLDGQSKPQLLDADGEAILVPDLPVRGLLTPFGVMAVTTPVWSPDGRWLAFLKRTQGSTQAWRIRSDGTDAEQLTHIATDVDALRWMDDGHGLLLSTTTALLTAQADRARAGRNGFLYDDRFVPNLSNLPQIAGPLPATIERLDIAAGSLRTATAQEQRSFNAANPSLLAAGASLLTTTSNGDRAWVAPRSAAYASPLELWTEAAGTRPTRCQASACTGPMVGLWWSSDGSELYFLQQHGWANSSFGLYRMRLGEAPRRVLETTDILAGCQSAAKKLLCARDAPTQPRRLVLIDPRTGVSRTLFDPNPEFAALTLGSVTRLHWRNIYGIACFGDLVLPEDYRSGTRLPLLVVQYRTKGFLRGGTGDEYPILAFAAHGYAVLSVDLPISVAQYERPSGWSSVSAMERSNMRQWRGRRGAASSILTGVKLVVARGMADPARIGLTGLSDGSTTARWLLDTSSTFAAASISSCCMEPRTSTIYGGQRWADQLRWLGYPAGTVRTPYPVFWQPMSLAMNARHMRTPLLMQLADEEYLLGLETFEALRDAKAPVEMYVFPGEHHDKIQPAHRLAIYQRNLDWFDFWLQNRERDRTADADQYRRWEAMAAQLKTRRHPVTPRSAHPSTH